MTLDKARSVLAERLRTRTDIWTDRKLCEVIAFAEDGKMHYENRCCCFIGVESSAVPHSQCDRRHYEPHKGLDPTSGEAEVAYLWLAPARYGATYTESEAERDREFIALLRAEIARREAEREQERSAVETREAVSA